MIPRLATLTALLIAAIAGVLVIPRFTDWLGLRRKNFKGEMIPGAYGIHIAFDSVLAVAALRTFGLIDQRITILYALVVMGMSGLGLLDDVYGSRNAGGFAGHFKKLLFERQLTTGAVKAIGGGALALAIGHSISSTGSDWIVNALLIALCANALNLTDLRPGRALAVFYTGLLGAVAMLWSLPMALLPLATLTAPALVLTPADRQGRAMMGDTGSNALGASLGLTFALYGDLTTRVVVLALLIGLHGFSERYSISQTIERCGILKKIDSLLGVR